MYMFCTVYLFSVQYYNMKYDLPSKRPQRAHFTDKVQYIRLIRCRLNVMYVHYVPLTSPAYYNPQDS